MLLCSLRNGTLGSGALSSHMVRSGHLHNLGTVLCKLRFEVKSPVTVNCGFLRTSRCGWRLIRCRRYFWIVKGIFQCCQSRAIQVKRFSITGLEEQNSSWSFHSTALLDTVNISPPPTPKVTSTSCRTCRQHKQREVPFGVASDSEF